MLEICSKELCSKLKDKGFSYPSDHYYDTEGTPEPLGLSYFHYDRCYQDYTGYPEDILYFAPTLESAKMWFRNEKNLHIDIQYVDELIQYSFTVTDIQDNEVIEDCMVKKRDFNHKGWTYEEALEEALIFTCDI